MDRSPTQPVKHRASVRADGPDPFELVLRSGRRASRTAELMRQIDEQYTRAPFYGSRRMVVELGKPAGESTGNACND
jgi:hypothetical protein